MVPRIAYVPPKNRACQARGAHRQLAQIISNRTPVRLRLSLWQRERRGPRSVPRVSRQKQHRARTFQEEYRELLRRHGVDFDERYVWD